MQKLYSILIGLCLLMFSCLGCSSGTQEERTGFVYNNIEYVALSSSNGGTPEQWRKNQGWEIPSFESWHSDKIYWGNINSNNRKATYDIRVYDDPSLDMFLYVYPEGLLMNYEGLLLKKGYFLPDYTLGNVIEKIVIVCEENEQYSKILIDDSEQIERLSSELKRATKDENWEETTLFDKNSMSYRLGIVYKGLNAIHWDRELTKDVQGNLGILRISANEDEYYDHVLPLSERTQKYFEELGIN